eukprot:109774_1
MLTIALQNDNTTSHKMKTLINVQTPNTIRTFDFTASDDDMKHGNKWMNGICPMIAGCTMLLVSDEPLIGLLILIIGLVIIIAFCAAEMCSCSETSYTISFNAHERIVSAYSGSHLIYSAPYNEFKQLSFQSHDAEFCVFCCGGTCVRYGRDSYRGGRVCMQFRNGQQLEINRQLCIKSEILRAQSMVQAANTYYFANVYSLETESDNSTTVSDEKERIPIGSYCYVDCESVHGVVTGYLSGDQYTLIDLFEQRERNAFGNRLTVITDEQVFNQVDQEYQEYLKPELGPEEGQ